MARHILDVAPKSAKVIFENDKVRVIEITMKRGQTLRMHSHKKGISYSLNGGKIRSKRKGGKFTVAKVRKGDVVWAARDGAEIHEVENLGGILRELCMEFKG